MVICDVTQFHSPLGGGVKRYLADKRRHLSRLPGARHILIIPSHRTCVTADGPHATYEIRSPRLPGSKSYRILLDRARILEAVRRERPDLIEVGDPYRTAWIGLDAARRLGIPAVAFYHSDFPRALDRTIVRFSGRLLARALARPIEHYLAGLYNRFATTIVASRHLTDTLRACGVRRLSHIPLGTDVELFHPRASRARVRAEFNLPEAARLLLFVGRLAREKNIRSLLGALDRLDPAGPPCHLVLVGDGELADWVRRQTAVRRDLGWLPYCESPQRLADLYSAADLFVHAGKWETFGIVSLEAQACGTPVLAVRGGGLEESLSTEPAPLLAADGGPDALAAALEAARRLPPRSPAESAARHRRIAARFSIDQTFAQIFALYRRLIERPPAVRTPEDPRHALPRSPV